MLARRYLKEGFVLDFVAALPVITQLRYLGVPFNSTVEMLLSGLGMFKILRVTRISGIINKLESSAAEKSSMKVLYVLYLLFLFHHIIACELWWTFSLE